MVSTVIRLTIPYPFASENEHIAAAEEFIRQYRAFEWRKHREKPIATLPVVRSFVKYEPEVGKS
mgnify:CR=1 FL=1